MKFSHAYLQTIKPGMMVLLKERDLKIFIAFRTAPGYCQWSPVSVKLDNTIMLALDIDNMHSEILFLHTTHSLIWVPAGNLNLFRLLEC
jgi:hypothetical protein